LTFNLIAKEISMKRTITILSLALAVTVFAQVATALQPKAEHLNKHQLSTLIATANTPAEHQRIATYYEASAQDYRAQAQEHEAMIAAYKSNSSLSNEKNRASTIGHCEYFVKALKELAVKSDELAKFHKEMAQQAENK
jgi:hypothetical protein